MVVFPHSKHSTLEAGHHGVISGTANQPASIDRLGKKGYEFDERETTVTTLTGADAMIGPFTTWQILIEEPPNTGLDLSGLTELYLEFQGKCEGF